MCCVADADIKKTLKGLIYQYFLNVQISFAAYF